MATKPKRRWKYIAVYPNGDGWKGSVLARNEHAAKVAAASEAPEKLGRQKTAKVHVTVWKAASKRQIFARY